MNFKAIKIIFPDFNLFLQHFSTLFTNKVNNVLFTFKDFNILYYETGLYTFL